MDIQFRKSSYVGANQGNYIRYVAIHDILYRVPYEWVPNLGFGAYHWTGCLHYVGDMLIY